MYKRQNQEYVLGKLDNKVVHTQLANLYLRLLDDDAEPVSYTHLDVYKRQGRVRKINRHKRMAYLRFDEGGEGDCVLQAALNVR